MKITVLAENTAVDERFGAEHGLSLLIETRGRHILFDTGQSALFARNATLCGVDLGEVDYAVLSHGHYDHGGGLGRFLELNDHAPVYLSQYAFEPHYNGDKYIGLDAQLKTHPRLIPVGDTLPLDTGITLLSLNGVDKPYAVDGAGLSAIIDGRRVPDDFRHEQYLLIEEAGRRILFSGCSHNGVLNIVSYFRPDILIGGFHFMNLPLDSNLLQNARELDGFGAGYYTCHCTGTEQYDYMKRCLPRLHYLSSGESITI